MPVLADLGTRLHLGSIQEKGASFVHDELISQDDFRLLKLRSGQGNDLACSLHHFTIGSETCPPYRALSYTWDQDDPRFHIQMPAGTVLKVRKNLWNALRSLRDAESDCYVWVDAICINQSSNLERNHQVKLMSQIYSNANVVVAWLESAGEDANVAKALKYISTGTIYRASRNSPVPLNRRVQETESKDYWSSIIDLCQLRYWSRKWIIQEVIAARTVVLQAGKAICAMADLERFFDQLSGLDLPESAQQFRRQLLDTSTARLANQRSTRHQDSGMLYELIERYADNKCQLPCDHVYALYSLAGEHRTHLNIDYASPPMERYCTVLQYVCNHENLPPRKGPRFCKLLGNLLGISEDEILNHHRLLNGLRITVSATVLGIQLRDESSASMRLRSLVTPLEPIASVSFSRAQNTDWNMISSRVEVPYLVGRPDMVYFGITGSEFVGLAACRLEAGDCIWHFPGMKFVFVVRRSSNDVTRIVGRALVFSAEDAPTDERTGKAWLRRSLKFTNVPQAEQTISLSYAKLLSLVSFSRDVVKIAHRPLSWGERTEACETHICAKCPRPISGCWGRRSTTQKLWIVGGVVGLTIVTIVLSVTLPLTIDCSSASAPSTGGGGSSASGDCCSGDCCGCSSGGCCC